MIILGLNAFHGDSSAAILRDGELIAAVEEERFRRVKHWAGFPEHAIRYCLEAGGLDLSDVDHIAINTRHRANLAAKVGYVLTSRPSYGLIASKLKTRRKRRSIAEYLTAAFPGQRLEARQHGVEHHTAHLASAFYVSPFSDASVLSVDGFGDFASTAWGVGHDTTLQEGGRVYFPHSLGIFYQALTQYLGFPNYGDEYKVMGLAPYGRPSEVARVGKLLRLHADGTFALDLRYFIHHRARIEYDWNDGSPAFARLFSPELEQLLGPSRRPADPLEQYHRDLAFAVQATYEAAFFNLIRSLHARHRLDAIAIAGGCGMNSVANGKIRRTTPYKKVYVQSAAGDAGGAIGSAFAVWHQLGGARASPMDHAYWGPSYGDGHIKDLISREADRIAGAGCRVSHVADEDALCALTADAIADGQVIGWFQGRLEWGPRALGNRSIVCDPRRADMKDILNLKIKRRESFRPFAPSIQREHVSEWFAEEDEVPFMMQVFQIREERRPAIPAVTHVDGSGRLQTVSRSTNPRYWRLIEAFRRRTGIPMVLNTSFNENEPVVCQPSEALDCFLRTRMDVLVLGDYVIQRGAPSH